MSRKDDSYPKAIGHYSLVGIIYGSMAGASGMLAAEKFIEGRYGIGLAFTAGSLFSGLMAYVGHHSIVEKTEEFARATNFRIEESSKLADFYRKMVNYMQLNLDAATARDLASEKKMDYRCEPGEGAKILPFRKVFRRRKHKDEPLDW